MANTKNKIYHLSVHCDNVLIAFSVNNETIFIALSNIDKYIKHTERFSYMR